MSKSSLTRKLCIVLGICLAAMLPLTVGCAQKGEQEENRPDINASQSSSHDIVSNSTFTDNKNGTFTFCYNNTFEQKCKVVVQIENGRMYQYDVPKGECEIVFPLTQGNGKYRIYLCKNTKENKYSVVESASISLNLSDDEIAFLGSNCIVNWNATNEAVKEAQKLVEGLDDDKKKIEAIYDYAVKNFAYDYDKMENVDKLSEEKAYVPDIEDTFTLRKGICYDISALMAAMFRSVNIPAKVVTGYTATTVSYHAWNQVYYMPNEDWKVMDVTYDIQMYQENRKYSMFKNFKDYENIIYIY